MRKYTDKENIENYLLLEVNDEFSTQIDVWIQEMSKHIEKETGRIFIADSNVSERIFEVKKRDSNEVGRFYFTPKDLFIDDAVEVTKLEVQDTDGQNKQEIAINQVFQYPINATPKFRLEVSPSATTQLRVGLQNIIVTGKWGYSVDVPLDIQFACTVLVAGIIQYAHRHQGQQASVNIGRYSATYKNDKQITDYERVQNILNSYRKII